MKTFMNKIWMGCTAVFRLHLGINNIVAILIVAYVINYLFHDKMTLALEVLFGPYDSTQASHTIVIGIVASVIAAVVFGIGGMFLLSWYQKTRLTGEYNAYALDERGKEEEWGTVTIRFSPLSSSIPQTPVKMRLIKDDVIMDGDGLIIDNRYLVGYYAETGQPERRRSGSFMYQLDGTGRKWEGRYLAITPEDSEPVVGSAKWVKN